MGKRTREIVALILLALLGLIVLAAMAWYIFIGHNWNVAATNIDERVGRMDGYTVVLFEGQALPQDEIARISDSQPMLDDQNRSQRKQNAEREEDVSDPVSMNAAASYYRQMGATVFLLHAEKPDVYTPPLLLNKNGFSLGIYFADGATSRMTAQMEATRLKARNANFVVLVIDDARFIDDPIASSDIVICTADEDLPSSGEYRNGAFCVDSPLVGHVQSIIISPSNVLTSKTITSL